MRAHLTIVNDDGVMFEGEVELKPSVARKRPRGEDKKVARVHVVHSHLTKLDFTLPERAFIKRYAKGLSGPKKFVLLLSHMVKGKADQEVSLKKIKDRWNKMTAAQLLGGEFNRFYSSAAREQAWVDVKKTGVYTLRAGWIDAFKPRATREY